MNYETMMVRKQLLDEETKKKYVDKRGQKEIDFLLNTGMAGLTLSDNPKDVKCLHVNLADYLLRERNEVGEMVFKHLKESDFPVRGTPTCKSNCDGCGSKIQNNKNTV
eukprot:TRINITY_DN7198_c0_g1_i1.p1 TRINITY_DN7198_c0_g1~~TRINITY_DN7198_c0_g1_i1.p1  ORF type:complete len:108 (-),score=20.48 TRINITY_DN7198_c0_g1_i1:76-399(-)